MSGSDLVPNMHAGYMFASYITGVLGAGVSLQLMSYRTGVKGLKNHLILIASSIMFGLVCVWSLHFLAMLSLNYTAVDTGIKYDMRFSEGLTVASLFIAVFTVYVGLRVVGDPNVQSIRETRFRIVFAGVAGSAGIVGMHFSGVSSIRMQADLYLDTGKVAFTVIIAAITVTVALWIFFEKAREYLGQTTWVIFWICSSAVMGGAVLATHSAGMWAVTFKSNPAIPLSSFDSLPDVNTLIKAILPINVITVVIMVFLMYKNRKYHMRAAAKAQSLILSVVMMNQRGQVLATMVNHLPSISIEHSYAGRGIFDRFNADFLRMLKTSFNWSAVPEIMSRLEQLHDDKQISEYSLELYRKFINAAEQMAAAFNIHITQLPICYWIPSTSMVTLIMKNKSAGTDTFSREIVKWVAPADVFPFLQEKLNVGQDPSEFFPSLFDYQQKCFMPMIDDRLNDLFRRVAQDLRIDKEEVEQEAQQWRATLGNYVKTRANLVTLVQSKDEWRQVTLPLMVKAQLRTIVNRLTEVNASTTGGNGNGNVAEFMRLGAVEDSVSTLHIGFFYIQASAAGLQVMIQRSGSFRIIPMVKFTRQQSFTPEIIAWLKSLCEREDTQNLALTKLKHQRSTSLNSSLNKRPAASSSSTDSINPTATVGNKNRGSAMGVAETAAARDSRLSARRTLSQQELLSAFSKTAALNLVLPPEITLPPTPAPAKFDRAQFNSVRSPEAFAAALEQAPAAGTLTPLPTTSLEQHNKHATSASPAEKKSNGLTEKRSSTSAIAAAAVDPPPPSSLQSPTAKESKHSTAAREESATLSGFISDFIAGCKSLGNLLGTDVDITAQALDGVHILPISNDLNLLLFVKVSLAMPPIFPAGYASNSLFFVPLTAFEIIHFSQQQQSSASGAGGQQDAYKAEYDNWTRNLIKSQLAKNESALTRVPVVSADRDLVFSNPVDSFKRISSSQFTPSSSMMQESDEVGQRRPGMMRGSGSKPTRHNQVQPTISSSSNTLAAPHRRRSTESLFDSTKQTSKANVKIRITGQKQSDNHHHTSSPEGATSSEDRPRRNSLFGTIFGHADFPTAEEAVDEVLDDEDEMV